MDGYTTMKFAEFVYYYHHCDTKTPMQGFDTETWRRLLVSYRNHSHTVMPSYFPDEPVAFMMIPITMPDLSKWVHDELRPYMTLKHPNKKHTAYRLKHIAEKEIGRYVCEGELQAALARIGFPPCDHYPISEKFFQAHNF